ncbi:ribosome silencing factor [Cyclobacterium sp.]|uniref:ribosome silencing factor n=1 Tax=Cyclobacterium sp. TaxID=1966343 RepID=UPI0019A5FE11|nr:ribosome silencing factor [Cyclobacterium sp.]MBD3627726.1 ribosome silencing factor [Cyclobacterium sp.]
MTAEELSNVIVKGMEDKKASDIVVMDLREINSTMTDFFVICSGTSDTQIEGISNAVEEEVFKTNNEKPWKSEGKNNRQWVLMDYVNVVVHIFLKEKREFYQLEDLWGDAKVTKINNH